MPSHLIDTVAFILSGQERKSAHYSKLLLNKIPVFGVVFCCPILLFHGIIYSLQLLAAQLLISRYPDKAALLRFHDLIIGILYDLTVADLYLLS